MFRAVGDDVRRREKSRMILFLLGDEGVARLHRARCMVFESVTISWANGAKRHRNGGISSNTIDVRLCNCRSMHSRRERANSESPRVTRPVASTDGIGHD